MGLIITYLTDYSTPPILISLAMGLPSLVLYIAEVVVLLTNGKKFDTAFYRLFLVRALIAIVCYAQSYFAVRFGRLGLLSWLFFSMKSWMISISWFLGYHLFHAENLATAFLLLHRLTAIANPLDHDRRWRLLFPLSIALILLGPLPVTWSIFTRCYYVHYSTETNTSFTEDICPTSPNGDDSYYAAVLGALFCLVCAGLNIACLVVYHHKRSVSVALMEGNGTAQRAYSQQSIEQRRVESRLTAYAVLTFLAQLLHAACMILIYLSIVFRSDFLFFATFNQIPLVTDLSTIVLPSWLMLWASRDMRALIMQAFELDLSKVAPAAGSHSLCSNYSTGGGNNPRSVTGNNDGLSTRIMRRNMAWES